MAGITERPGGDVAGKRDAGPSASGGGRSRGGRKSAAAGTRRRAADAGSKPSVDEQKAASVPEMTDLYRRLLTELAERFGGAIDDANADAIAYAAAELYHRDFEPRLWEERSAHDLLDLFGVPRAGVFGTFSLSERLLLFQKRSSQTQYVSRAHELLTSLGVPLQDDAGVDQSLKWRLERVLAAVNGSAAVAGPAPVETPPDEPAELGKPADSADAVPPAEPAEPADTGLVDNTEGDDSEPAVAEPAVPPEAVAEGPVAHEPVAEEPVAEPTAEPGAEPVAEPVAEPTAAQLVDAVRTLEHAARVEADLSNTADEAEGIDLVRLTDTLHGVQGEIAAVRELVESFEIGLRRQLDDLQSQIAVTGQEGRPVARGPAMVPPASFDATGPLPDMPLDAGEEPIKERHTLRRVLLVLLLLVLALMLAGGIALIAAVGWDSLRSQSRELVVLLT